MARKALEWLGPDGCRRIFGELVSVNEAKSTGSRMWASCPLHGPETKPSFTYRPDKDCYFCFGCRASGDLIDLFGTLNGLDEKDGFLRFKERYAPGASSDRSAQSGPKPAPYVWAPSSAVEAPARWSVNADALLRKGASVLADNADIMAWLEKRGILPETVQACRLAWIAEDRYPTFSSWGLPPEKNERGKERKIWLPTGLVIPWMRGGLVQKMKIRRFDTANGPRGMEDVKYYMVRGSAASMSVYGKGQASIVALIESELDGVLLWQDLRRFGVVTLAGPAGNKPNEAEDRLLSRADCIIVALDNDKAGKTASRWWLDRYPQAVRRPVPPSMGKDHGDAVAAGLSVVDWFRAALPSHFLRFVDRALERAAASAAVPATMLETSQESSAPAPVEPDAHISPQTEHPPVPVPAPPVPGQRLTRLRGRMQRHVIDGASHVSAFKTGNSWIRARQEQLLELGWTRRTLFRAARFRYPCGGWGLAWNKNWNDDRLTSVDLRPDGTVVWTIQDRDREVTFTATPKQCGA